MLLAIDAGNTNVVCAIFDGDRKRGQWRIATDGRRTADEYAVWLVALMTMSGLKREDVDAAILASVVPAATFNLQRLCIDHFGVEPMRVGAPGIHLGLEIRINNPREAEPTAFSTRWLRLRSIRHLWSSSISVRERRSTWSMPMGPSVAASLRPGPVLRWMRFTVWRLSFPRSTSCGRRRSSDAGP